ncbi:hypothetical protein [Anaeromicrobium sediminis]|uniref:DUF3324 domain-containing protein n=1 Tax=Anaeromicrobium sediminis TaxID=1478221 RepID=A0A267MCP7_9FIRM|nr:hypothetical protein [Anaeromicrobium sediminis]PAB57364.1 hypothetical protein CCE28_18875 [Anaeromicrobium sediminis]
MRKIMLFLLMIILMTNISYANAGPWIYEGAPVLNPVPYENNNVEVLNEQIEFNINRKDLGIAHVNVNYRMKNTSDKREKINMCFPFVGRGIHLKNKFAKITYNGVEIDSEIKVLKNLQFDHEEGLKGKAIYKDTFNKNLSFSDIIDELNNTKEAYEDLSENAIYAILFKVKMEPKVENTLNISYVQKSGRSRTDSKSSYTYNRFDYYYFLEPASYWKSFNDLNIKIIAPRGTDISNSSLTLEKEKKIYIGNFKRLPKENFTFEVVSLKDTKGYFGFKEMVLTIIMFFLIGKIFVSIKRKKGR